MHAHELLQERASTVRATHNEDRSVSIFEKDRGSFRSRDTRLARFLNRVFKSWVVEADIKFAACIFFQHSRTIPNTPPPEEATEKHASRKESAN
mmetsp:Transcript_12975/g.50746  ORF Transcript_12975/g.50746 Transcript_12975/m.50746 type:complete len:94 (+) Transcript_12975:1784-2065(+)